MDNNFEQAQTVIDIVDLVDKIKQINVQLSEKNHDKMYNLLAEIKMSYPIEISAVEVLSGDVAPQPYQYFTTDKLIQKLLYFRQALYLIGAGKGIEAYINEEGK